MSTAARWLAILTLVAAPARAPPQAKFVGVLLAAAETGFDPVRTHDYYSGTILEAIFDTLRTYDYLARPANLGASAAAEMPKVSAVGLTYPLRIREGIYFSDDAAFKGGRRELTAQDFA